MKARTAAVAAAAPAVGVLALAGVAYVVDRRSIVVAAPVGTVLLVAAGLVAVAGTIWLVWRSDRARARSRAATGAREAAAAEHRRFLDRLDHELKNPITAIRAAVAVSRDDTPHLATIAAQTDRLSHLVGDLRKLSELQTASIERVPVDMAEIVRDVAAAIEDAHARPVDVVLPSAPWPLSLVTGDPDLLFVAVFNVVANAVKYSSPTDAVEVRGLEREARVVVEVADTGRGIPEKDLPTVFDELARADNARDRPGSGLGLALVRTIVDRHSGTVAITSVEGRGTRVSVELPVRG